MAKLCVCPEPSIYLTPRQESARTIATAVTMFLLPLLGLTMMGIALTPQSVYYLAPIDTSGKMSYTPVGGVSGNARFDWNWKTCSINYVSSDGTKSTSIPISDFNILYILHWNYPAGSIVIKCDCNRWTTSTRNKIAWTGFWITVSACPLCWCIWVYMTRRKYTEIY